MRLIDLKCDLQRISSDELCWTLLQIDVRHGVASGNQLRYAALFGSLLVVIYASENNFKSTK